MSLKAVDDKIEAVRARAAAGQSFVRETQRQIEQNSELTPDGKKKQLDELKASAKAKMAMLRAEEDKLATDKRTELERTVLGAVGTDPAAVISHRDAQDRAEQIASADDAERIMKRALSSGDKTLAMAVAQVALEKGYRNANEAFASANPSIAEAAHDLAQLNQYFQQGGLARAAAYSV